MAVSRALASLGRLIRRTSPPPADVLEAYAHEVIPVLDRAEWLYQYWLEQSTLFTDGEKLGNVAAIHRWETATMGRSLERVVPPAALAGAHESVIEALELASRAAQLLSSGSRFHNANAVCEGQALLGVSRERRLAALKSMRKYLLQVPPPPPPEVEAGPEAADAAPSALANAPAAPDPTPTAVTPEVAAPDEVTQPPASPSDDDPADDASPVPAFLDNLDNVPAASPAPTEPSAPVERHASAAQPGWGELFGRSESQAER